MKKLNSAEELPDWFSIKKYQSLKEMSLFDLYDELEHRSYINYAKQYQPDNYRESFKQLISSPETDKKGTAVHSVVKLVHRMDYRSIDFLNRAMEHSGNKDLFRANRKWNERYSNGGKGFAGKGLGNEIYLKVSLDAKDSLILSSVKGAIRRARKEYEIPEPLSTAKIPTIVGKILSYRSIPYFDLKTWADIEGKKITNEAMARILFPENFNKSARDIQDYTARYANTMISREFLLSFGSVK